MKINPCLSKQVIILFKSKIFHAASESEMQSLNGAKTEKFESLV